MKRLTKKEEVIMNHFWDKGPLFVRELRELYPEPQPHFSTLSTQVRTLEEEGFVVTVHGKGTYVAATDQQLAMEARKKSVEDDFAQAVRKARAVGMTAEDILEIVRIILEEY